ncbi:phospholipase A [Chitinimonas arctica]|uniref:Phospholipase A1 n=1 Tax=Chitinimonas arctica TaxID=2594795 RepID=A0A516SL47_9NEIS|nr:phospholipase A [Chitinimonas arctica]QDQ28880.1 phospholipase A [Chitinimonas arctica]
MTRIYLSTFALLGSSVLASPLGPNQCLDIAADTARLACYDAALGFQAESKAAQQKPAVAEGKPASPTQLDAGWELEPKSKLGAFVLRSHRANYFLPVSYNVRSNRMPHSPAADHRTTTPQRLQDTEAKFQFSLKTKLAQNLFGENGDLWAAYTQTSRWQIYDADNSRPFRETNYEPEAMLVFRTPYRLFGWQGKMLSLGFNHQSNGRSVPLSRSWNRGIATIGLEKDDWTLVLRPWWRLPEGGSDDNPDIADHIGRGDITLSRRFGDHLVTVMGRHTFRGAGRSRGAAQLDWAFPLSGNLKGYVQLFNGYGESLIDYNHRSTYIGVGVTLLDSQ